MIYTASVACANQLNIDEDVSVLMENNVTYLHVDIMDGHDVPNLSSNLDLLVELKKKYPKCVLDTHLMVTNPLDYVDRCAKIGVDYFVTHASNIGNVDEYIKTVKEKGMKVGLILKLEDDFNFIERYLPQIDQALVMAITPGAYGQSFNEVVFEKVRKLNEYKKLNNLHFLISVDGGVTLERAKQLKNVGADLIVLGVFTVFKQSDGVLAGLNRLNKILEE